MDQHGLIFQNRDELLCIDVNRIFYIKSDGNYSQIYTNTNLKLPTQVGTNLAGIEVELDRFFRHKKHTFARLSKKYIINLDYVYRISIPRKLLIMTDFEHVVYTITDVPAERLKALKDIVTELKYKK